MSLLETVDCGCNVDTNELLKHSGQSLTTSQKVMGKYNFVRLLGRGAFGTVKLALDRESNTYVSLIYKWHQLFHLLSQHEIACFYRWTYFIAWDLKLPA